MFSLFSLWIIRKGEKKMSILTVENVSHSYGEKTILYNACFRLLKGEHVGLVGKNGIGKSTLLRLLTGELIHDDGNIEWFPHVKIGFCNSI